MAWRSEQDSSWPRLCDANADIARPKFGELMSVQRYETADGTQWRVRWREPDGKMRSRTVVNKREALVLDGDIKARKFKGEALPRAGRETLASAFDQWQRLVAPSLASTTRRTYLASWNAHIKDRFDHYRLNELTADPQLLDELLAEMRERGVGDAAQRKVLVVLSAVLTAAVGWKKIATNPVWRLRKPPGTRQRNPHPFPPVVIERIRLRVQRRATKDATKARALGDACFVSLMAYAGLRPGEALALTWGDIGARTISVDKAVRDGAEAPTKTGAVRSVPLVTPLKDDLFEYRMMRDMPPNDTLVLPAQNSGYWSRSEANNWRNRVWKPITLKLAESDRALRPLAESRPYDCRGSFVSLHLRAGASPLEVAQWAGHSPAVMFKHYANVIEELVGEPVLDAVEQITRARDAVAEMPAEELDELTAELFEQPTVTGGEGPRHAAHIFYAPENR
jgi:integrase